MTQVVGAGAVLPAEAGTGRAESSLRSRAWWKIADQGLSSLTVVGLSLFVARNVGHHSFGSFGLALVTFSFALGLVRAMVSDVFLIQFSDVVPRVRRQAAEEATGGAVALGLLAGALCCLIASLLPGHESRMAVFALGLALPGLLVQDSFRFILIATGRPVTAVVLGLGCAVTQLAAVALLIEAGHGSILPITAAWGGAGLITACLASQLAGLRPALRRAPLWFALNRHLNVRMSVDYVLGLGALNLAYCLIGAIVGLSAVGALWVAQMFLVPAYLVVTGASSLLRPVFAARAWKNQPLVRPALLTGLGLAAAASIWTAVVFAVPDSIGVRLAGASWTGARDVLGPAAVGVIALAFAAGAGLALRALGRTAVLLQTALVQTLLLFGLGIVGADLDGVRGAATGLVIAHVVGAATLWIRFLRGGELRASGKRANLPLR